MPSLKAIRKRITSVKNTKKITSAMKLVAGARLRRAQEAIWAARPYATRMQEVTNELAVRADVRAIQLADLDAPLGPLADEADAETKQIHAVRKAAKLLLHRPVEKRVAIVLLTSDRGLCGAFNSNLNRAAERFLVDNADRLESAALNIVGRKGRDYFKRKKGVEIKREWSAPQAQGPALALAREIANTVTSDFLAGEIDAVYIVYNEFKSAISQKVQIAPLLPIAPAPVEIEDGGARIDFKYEPSVEAVLSHLVPLHLETQIYRALLESIASEFGSKMSAMDSATRSASDMISALTLSFNRARQAAITKELMEIIGGAEALKG